MLSSIFCNVALCGIGITLSNVPRLFRDASLSSLLDVVHVVCRFLFLFSLAFVFVVSVVFDGAIVCVTILIQ